MEMLKVVDRFAVGSPMSWASAKLSTFTQRGFDREFPTVLSSEAPFGPRCVNNSSGTRRGFVMQRVVQSMTPEEERLWLERLKAGTLFPTIKHPDKPLRPRVRRHKNWVTLSDDERFWAQVSFSEGCWEWAGRVQPNRYGMFGRVYAHRYAWEFANGSIPNGMSVCHHCDNPPCVRPDHIFIGTARDNMQDRERKGRGRFGLNAPNGPHVLSPLCKRGHLRTGGKCKICHAQAARRSYLKAKAEGRR